MRPEFEAAFTSYPESREKKLATRGRLHYDGNGSVYGKRK